MKLKNVKHYNVYVPAGRGTLAFLPGEVIEFEGAEDGVLAKEILTSDKVTNFVETDEKADKVYGEDKEEKPAEETPAVEESPEKEELPVGEDTQAPVEGAKVEEKPEEKTDEGLEEIPAVETPAEENARKEAKNKKE